MQEEYPPESQVEAHISELTKKAKMLIDR